MGSRAAQAGSKGKQRGKGGDRGIIGRIEYKDAGGEKWEVVEKELEDQSK